MKKWIRKIIRKLKTKWYKGECRHLCWFCAFKNYCQDSWE